MTTAAQDISNYDGQPIFLYQFSRTSKPTLGGPSVTTFYRYTSSDQDWTDASDIVWRAVAISDDGIRQSGDTTADQLTITMPFDSAVPQLFVGSPPSDPIMAQIRHTNVDETDSFLAWAGVVAGVTRSASEGGHSIGTASVGAKIVCNTLGATMDRAGVRLSWSRQCPHDLYGFECRANPASFVTTGTITAKTGSTISADEFNAVAIENHGTTGPIDHVEINNPGTLFAVADTGTIFRAGTPDATYYVAAVDDEGGVQTLTVTPGTQYPDSTNTATSTSAPQPGTGTGLTVDVVVKTFTKAFTFAGGFLEWIGDDFHANRLGIISHDGDTITLLGRTDKLQVGQVVYAFLGCDHTPPVCTSVFNNMVNYGGHNYMPDLLNPFNGDLIF